MKPFVVSFSLVMGAMDALTGALLVGAPAKVLRIAGIGMRGGDGAMILLRWIGVFVASVGLSYLWSMGGRDPDERRRRLHGAWGSTAIVRANVAVFCVAAVITAQLPPAALIVAGVDGVVAIIQVIGMQRGWTRW